MYEASVDQKKHAVTPWSTLISIVTSSKTSRDRFGQKRFVTVLSVQLSITFGGSTLPKLHLALFDSSGQQAIQDKNLQDPSWSHDKTCNLQHQPTL